MLVISTTIWSDAVLHFYIFSFGVWNVNLSEDPSEGLEDCISLPAQKHFLYSPVSWRDEELENVHLQPPRGDHSHKEHFQAAPALQEKQEGAQH